MPSHGPRESPVWFVFDTPSAKELASGEAGSGPAGGLLRAFCMQVGLDPTACHYTYLWPHAAPANKIERMFNSGIPKPELSISVLGLIESIKESKPNVVVAVGAASMLLLTGKGHFDKGTIVGLHDYRGSVLTCQWIPGQKVIATFDPAYVLRAYSDHPILLLDLERIRKESAFAGVRRPQKELICDPQGDQLMEVRDRLMDEGDTLTVDIEYIGSRLLCVGLTSDASWATSIAWSGPTQQSVIRQVCLSGKPLNMQNAMFDCSILEWHYDMPVIEHLAYDTMLAAHALNPELPKGLDFLCSVYTDQPYYKSMVNWNLIKQGKQDPSILYEYNAIDAWTQHEIMDKQISDEFVHRPDKWEIYQHEMTLLKPLWEMSKRGMRIDHKKLGEFEEQLNNELKIHETILVVMAGGRSINVASGPEVAWLLFDHLRLRPAGKTKRGIPKTDDKTLASVLGRVKTPQQKLAIELIRKARKCRSMLSKFIEVELDTDGRTRGMYNPAGTTTGRLASKKFYPTGLGHQQQNIPRSARFVFVPDTGYRFGSVDYERAESLVVAHYTNDSLMLRHHEPGADAHRMLASLFFKKDEADITYEERYLMKQTRHAGNYMEGHITFMRSVNQKSNETGISITSKQAEEFITWYRNVHHGLKPWWSRVRDTIYRKNEISTMLGRPRTFFNRIDACLPVAVAYGPQGTVGDLMNVGLLNLSGVVGPLAKRFLPWHEEIPEIGAELTSMGFQLLNQVHDSVGFQFKPQHETRVRELIEKCLTIPLRNPITHEPFIIGQDLKVGNSWGEAD